MAIATEAMLSLPCSCNAKWITGCIVVNSSAALGKVIREHERHILSVKTNWISDCVHCSPASKRTFESIPLFDLKYCPRDGKASDSPADESVFQARSPDLKPASPPHHRLCTGNSKLDVHQIQTTGDGSRIPARRFCTATMPSVKLSCRYRANILL